jgi:hypothetical protein
VKTEKKCNKCSIVLDDTNWSASRKKNYRYICNSCATQAERTRRLSSEQIRLRKNACERKRIANRSKERVKADKLTAFKRFLEKNYSLSLAQYNEMRVSQHFRCKICYNLPGPKGLHIDHDHSTSEVRALLCMKCNMALGLFNDDPELMIKASEYVRKYKVNG